MRESASAPLTSVPLLHGEDGSGEPNVASHSEAFKTAIQVQMQVEALTTTAQAAAKHSRWLTKYVSTLGEVSI